MFKEFSPLLIVKRLLECAVEFFHFIYVMWRYSLYTFLYVAFVTEGHMVEQFYISYMCLPFLNNVYNINK